MAALGGSSPGGQAVCDVGKKMCMDEKFEGVRSEVMADFEQRRCDGVASPYHHGYMWIPVEVLVEEDSQHFDGG